MSFRYPFNLKITHPEWRSTIVQALASMNTHYLAALQNQTGWLPGPDRIFHAFAQPLSHTRTLLLGESPYPRAASANGLAFYDAAVTALWSPTGLAKAVNRATSLRNIIKMLLVAEGMLSPDDTRQAAIAQLD